jgi:hypothetical protein
MPSIGRGAAAEPASDYCLSRFQWQAPARLLQRSHSAADFVAALRREIPM